MLIDTKPRRNTFDLRKGYSKQRKNYLMRIMVQNKLSVIKNYGENKAFQPSVFINIFGKTKNGVGIYTRILEQGANDTENEEL